MKGKRPHRLRQQMRKGEGGEGEGGVTCAKVGRAAGSWSQHCSMSMMYSE